MYYVITTTDDGLTAWAFWAGDGFLTREQAPQVSTDRDFRQPFNTHADAERLAHAVEVELSLDAEIVKMD